MKDASLEAQWLMDRSEAAGYVVIVVSASFGGQRTMRLYAFICLPEPRGRSNLSVAEAEAEAEAKREVGANFEKV